MKVIFAVVITDVSAHKMFDKSLLDHFERDEIMVHKINLSDLKDIGKMPDYLTDWANYEKVVIICNAETATFFTDVHGAINNTELWITKWPIDYNLQGKYKLFDMASKMSAAARELLAA